MDWGGKPQNPEISGWHWLMSKDSGHIYSHFWGNYGGEKCWVPENNSAYLWEPTTEEMADNFYYIEPAVPQNMELVNKLRAEISERKAAEKSAEEARWRDTPPHYPAWVERAPDSNT